MPAYMVIQAQITDPLKFKAYARAAGKLVAEFGGEYIVRGSMAEALEGEWEPLTKYVISKWPSRRQALAFWNSHEYAKLKQLRLGAAKVCVAMLEAVGDESAEARVDERFDGE